MDTLLSTVMAVIAGLVLIALAVWLYTSNRKNRKIKDALFQLGLGYKRFNSDGVNQTPQEIEFKNGKKELNLLIKML